MDSVNMREGRESSRPLAADPRVDSTQLMRPSLARPVAAPCCRSSQISLSSKNRRLMPLL